MGLVLTDSPVCHAGAPERGFTLIEVLVALAILTISLTAVFRLQSQTMLMSEKARFFSIAPLLAQARLSEIEGVEFGSLAGGSGDFDVEHPGFGWTMQVEEVPNELLEHQRFHFVRIDLTISYNDDQSYVLRTYRLYPE